MRGEFRSSKSKNYLKSPKTCGLFEHEYGIELTDEQWKEVAQHVEICLRNFYASDIYHSLRSHSKEDWLEVEEFSSFRPDNVKINLVMDFAIREGVDILLYDWKTGENLSEDLNRSVNTEKRTRNKTWSSEFLVLGNLPSLPGSISTNAPKSAIFVTTPS